MKLEAWLAVEYWCPEVEKRSETSAGSRLELGQGSFPREYVGHSDWVSERACGNRRFEQDPRKRPRLSVRPTLCDVSGCKGSYTLDDA